MREELTQYVNLLFAGSDNTEQMRQEILQNTLDRYDDLIAQGKSPESAYRIAITGIGDLEEILGSSRERTAQYAPGVLPDSAGIPVSQIIRAFAVGMYIICLAPLILLDMFGLSELGVVGTLIIIAAATVLIFLFPGRKNAQEQEPAISRPDDSVVRLIRGTAIGLYIVSIAPIMLLDRFGLENVGVTCTLILIALATVLLLIYRKPRLPKAVQQEAASDTPYSALRKSIDKMISTIGLVSYFVISFRTGAWEITWVIFLIIPAVKGLVNACIDLKNS